ncbi:hypothetical protein CC2G_013918 [Coprinopsis cinerea AmutBmut pab1-1]|nr:hypothetical protein CC2G_013918 [Coprinopsis cinerea AmutBmut pab1-1]
MCPTNLTLVARPYPPPPAPHSPTAPVPTSPQSPPSSFPHLLFISGHGGSAMPGRGPRSPGPVERSATPECSGNAPRDTLHPIQRERSNSRRSLTPTPPEPSTAQVETP